MQFCPDCGTKNGDGAKFCESCGHGFKPMETQAPRVEQNYNNQNQSNELPASKFDGTVWQYIGYTLLMGFLSMITLGLATPWLIAMFWKWEVGHTVVNGRRLEFSGGGGGLFLTWLKILVLTIITLGIYSFWGYLEIQRWKVKNTNFA